MDNTPPRDDNEPTYQDHKPSTTPNPYLQDFGESKLPPPPPRTPSRRTGKIVAVVLYIILILAASVFAYIIGFESGKSTPQRTPTAQSYDPGAQILIQQQPSNGRGNPSLGWTCYMSDGDYQTVFAEFDNSNLDAFASDCYNFYLQELGGGIGIPYPNQYSQNSTAQCSGTFKDHTHWTVFAPGMLVILQKMCTTLKAES